MFLADEVLHSGGAHALCEGALGVVARRGQRVRLEEVHWCPIRCRAASYRATEAAMAAFSDSTAVVGIRRAQASARRLGLTPCDSLPITMTQGRARSQAARIEPSPGVKA